jgi:hypothetical protein
VFVAQQYCKTRECYLVAVHVIGGDLSCLATTSRAPGGVFGAPLPAPPAPLQQDAWQAVWAYSD